MATTTKAWNFLLVASGRHQLRVEHIGTPSQVVYIDGEMQTVREALLFSGPENTLLELRPVGHDWALLCNGIFVEDYTSARRSSGDESLRELRGRPDGSYMICPEIDTESLRLNAIKKFRFLTEGQSHEVLLAHQDNIWQILCDGTLVDRTAHRSSWRSADDSEAVFHFPSPCGRLLRAYVKMEYQMTQQTLAFANNLVRAKDEAERNRDKVWLIKLIVNGRKVPACWSLAFGDIAPYAEDPPEVQVAYLPAFVDGHQILVLTPEGKWRADNSSLRAARLIGIAFRTRKDMKCRLRGTLRWGEEINGTDEGDGWIRCVPGSEERHAPRRYSTTAPTRQPDAPAVEPSGGTEEACGEGGDSEGEDEEDNEDNALPGAENLPTSQDALPQGVSFDNDSGSYQATVRASATGRFVLLGQFSTPEEAHQKYLEALPTYCPDKRVLPQISA